MDSSAQKKIKVLITNAGSYLGATLADSLLLQNCEVFAQGNSPLLSPLLGKTYFTLLEFNIGQPLPSYLPNFDLVFHLDLLSKNQEQFLTGAHLSPQIRNIILGMKGKKVFVLAPLLTNSDFLDYLGHEEETKEPFKLFLIGDLYGPKMPLSPGAEIGPGQNVLAGLISQALTTDKIILPNEGLKMIYPAYITDVIFAINKLAFGQECKNVQAIVSEDPKTSLSVAYEIQNTASFVAGRQLDLFFSGSSPQRVDPEPIFKVHELDFLPKVKLAEGLKKTFEYYRESGKTHPQFILSEKTPSFRAEMKRILSEEKRPTAFRPWESIVEKKRFPQDIQEIPTSRLPKVNPKFLISKIPHANSRFRLKNICLLIFVILLLIFAKTTFDIYRGVTNFKNAQKALYSGDLKKTQDKAQKAQKAFGAAYNKSKILTAPIGLIFPKQIKSLNLSLSSASIGASSLVYFVQASQVLVHDFSIITSKDTNTSGLDLESPAADFRRSLFYSSYARSQAKQAENAIFLKPRIENLENSLEDFGSMTSSILELTNLVNDLTGAGSAKTYLVLLQNNNELRPGGGFIGNFGTIEFDQGKLKNITVEDIYTIDGQLKEKIQPPKQLAEKIGIDQLYLRDSNWSPDFTLNAATARDFFKKETGKSVDGVIAINLTFIQNLLEKLGPVKLEDFKNEEITAQNLFDRGQYWSEVGFFPGSTNKRDFFGALSRTLVAKILDGKNFSSWLTLIQVTKNALAEKDLMLTFDNPNLATFIATHGWNQPVPPADFNPTDDTTGTRDFLALSEANLGANKANHFLERKLAYEMTIGRDADLIAKLTITYTNNSQAETWPAGKYVNFLRVCVPFAADLYEFKNGDNSDLKSFEVTTSGSLTTFATYVEVPIKSTRQVSFAYRIPKNIKLEKTPYYHLYVQKQPGTGQDPFEFTFNLPAYLKVKSVNQDPKLSGSQNLTVKTDLATDREFEIEVAKK